MNTNQTDKRRGMAAVIKEFFQMSASDAVREYKALDDKDKGELASAAARALGLQQEDCSFEFVTY